MNDNKFKVTIDDGYCSYEYEYDMNDEVSIYDIASGISKQFDVPMPEGKIKRRVDIDEVLSRRSYSEPIP